MMEQNKGVSSQINSFPGIRLILGLGNPTEQYRHNRHNVGMWLVDELAARMHCSWSLEKKLQSSLCEWKENSERCLLAKPLTYMNHSGWVARAICQYYKLPICSVLVVHDELVLPVGDGKLKFGGGHGGHNGLRDIIKELGRADFYRLRLGIGHPGNGEWVTDYVLSNPSHAEHQQIKAAISRSLGSFSLLLEGKFDKALQQINSKGNTT